MTQRSTFPEFSIPAVLPYSEDDIWANLSATMIRRGAAYQRRGDVLAVSASADGRRITGEVQGSDIEPYRVQIDITPGPAGQSRIFGSCTCPVGFACKHVAAVLIEALDRVIDQPRRAVPAVATPAPAPAPPKPTDPLAGPLATWLQSLTPRTDDAEPRKGGPAPECVLYLLDTTPIGDRPRTTVRTIITRPLKAGGYGAERSNSFTSLAYSAARYVQPDDSFIARMATASNVQYDGGLPDDPASIDLLLQRMIATGRCHWRTKANPPLRPGTPQRGAIGWTVTPDGNQHPAIEAVDEGLVVLPCARPWYIDTETWECGPLDIDLPARLIGPLLSAPAVAPHQAAALAERLAGIFPPDVPMPRPRTDLVEKILDENPVPCLTLLSRRSPPPAWTYYSPRGATETWMDLALVGFDYAGLRIDAATPPVEQRRLEGNRIVVRRRNLDAERAALRALQGLGMKPPVTLPADLPRGAAALTFPDAPPEQWLTFMHRTVPQLRDAGWRIDIEPGFRHDVVFADGDWDAKIDESGSGWWFSLDLGIVADGERIALLPVLVDALRRLKDPSAPGALESLAVDGIVYGRLPDGRSVALPFDRVQAILAVLVELFDARALGDGSSLDISLVQAEGLAAIAEATRLRWLGGQRLRDLVDRLRASGGIHPVAPPENLRATLRPYQREGLNWLQFIGEHGLGGLLADDMGLGKTVQVLAHLLAEKNAGRLDQPCLVVCPTSLVPNWQAEAARFAPDLKVLTLHGPDRMNRFDEREQADLVLTSYALMLRDTNILADTDWHVVVMDEAQAIKNPAARVTQIACTLKARHRLCLTGTPVENHLGEAWSQFAFLMPGLLGDSRLFTRLFRTPIEKKGDAERRAVLARRLKPFILRRTKSEVAADLPPKTEIVRHIELEGDQRDLYETLRLAMHQKIRQEIAARGLARSHILILDALLKLRQACCDPRLVKLDRARKVKSSAKLEYLMEVLPAMIEEGRRVLLFSQFTSMLDLIKPTLIKAHIPFVELTGDTTDRAAPVATFQAGRVPLFLISLKAGGTGLNLTAADTVIHYDPWWNPAVEDQATDRAHRIGQDKPVFVYKLIASGTVEDRMLELQDRKRILAGAVFDPDAAGTAGFDESDLDRLFEPLG
jgi:superfamily II DNA or RNA helicase